MTFQERDEAKWQAFVVELCTLPPNLIVYVNESGMDNPDQYDYASESTPTTVPCAEIWAAQGRVNMIAQIIVQPKIARLLTD